jgi:hypothetical protein
MNTMARKTVPILRNVKEKLIEKKQTKKVGGHF